MMRQMFRFTIDTNAQDLASQSLFSVFSINIKMGFMGVFQERSSEMNSEEIFDIKRIIQIPNEDRSGPSDEKVAAISVLLCLLGCLLLLFGMYIKSICKDQRNRIPPEEMDQIMADYLTTEMIIADLLNHDHGNVYGNVYYIQNVPPPTYDTLSPPPPTYQEAILGELLKKTSLKAKYSNY